MPTFQEFLRKKAEEEQQPERRKRRDEWIGAVGRLIDQLRAWLAESHPEGLLDVIPLEVEKREPGLGSYKIPGLKVGIGDAAVRVVPMGRDALGLIESRGEAPMRAQGRVDITDGVQKYIFYRAIKDGQDVWY